MNFKESCKKDIKISYICSNEYNYFLNKKGVIGVALGYKIMKGFYTNCKCITVFVQKKLSCSKLLNKNIIPKYFKGIQTDVVESGIATCNSLNTRIRPALNGYSIGNALRDNFATSGCLVHDKYLYILGNNHSLALNNEAPIESPILQPGVDDGGTIVKDVIGHLKRFVPIKFIEGSSKPENFVDCALCKVISRSFVSPKIALIGIPKGIDKVKLKENVKKVGRTSELTFGKVGNISGTIEVYCANVDKHALFKNQIVTTRMTKPGDSGSLLLNQNNYGVGLCMGSLDYATICNPIDDVLKSLKVEIVTS